MSNTALLPHNSDDEHDAPSGASAPLNLTHLRALTDSRGIFEHADGAAIRREHGYCTDDNARLLIVAVRDKSWQADDLVELALRFVIDAQDPQGRTRNRLSVNGGWLDAPATEDCWGRSLWAFGVTAAEHPSRDVQAGARRGFNVGARHRSKSTRTMAFAALGAAAMLADDLDHTAAYNLLFDAATVLEPRSRSLSRQQKDAAAATTAAVPIEWDWFEARLTYANATVAEALIAAGAGLDRDRFLDRGLFLLRWLLDREMASGHLSVVGHEGSGPTDPLPQFDQQPIEVAAMASACARAFAVTKDRSWLVGVRAAYDWFHGANDAGLVMHDVHTGGGYDGLHANGVNHNQGAESTLAFLATCQTAHGCE